MSAKSRLAFGLTFISFCMMAMMMKDMRIIISEGSSLSTIMRKGDPTTIRPPLSPDVSRGLSIDFGDGTCQWMEPRRLALDSKPFGTLFASYPAAGMRITWQQTEGLTGVKVGDDYWFTGDIVGLLKTQYPHFEGIWSWKDDMDQVILLLRNPRWAIPSHNTISNELEYAHEWTVSERNIKNTFKKRAPLDYWINWRDLHFEDEIKLWAYHIDFWMENGTQYWMDDDSQRLGQSPYPFLDEANQANWPKDKHCQLMDCVPTTVISYENLKNDITGPIELQKIAGVLRGKEGVNESGLVVMNHTYTYNETIIENITETINVTSVIGNITYTNETNIIVGNNTYLNETTINGEPHVVKGMVTDEAMDCIWHSTWLYAHEPNNLDRDDPGETPAEAYNFTSSQMDTILDTLVMMRNKYSRDNWVHQQIAIDLVSNLDNYITEVKEEIYNMTQRPEEYKNDAPEQHEEIYLKAWNEGIGQGDRENLAKTIAYYGYNPLKAYLKDGTTPPPTEMPSSSSVPSKAPQLSILTSTKSSNMEKGIDATRVDKELVKKRTDNKLKSASNGSPKELLFTQKNGEGSSGCEINEAPLPDIYQLDGRCVKLSDFIVDTLHNLLDHIQFIGSESSKQIFDAIDLIAARLLELGLGDVATDNFCFGNFKGTYFGDANDASLFNNAIAVDGCANLPLNKDSEYTVVSSAITIPKGVCSNAKAKQAKFCMAVSICPETKLPTVAVSMNDQTISCVANVVPVAGLATSVSSTAGADFDVGFGISLSNQFRVDMILYTILDDWNDKLITYQMKAMYYDRISMSIDPFKSTKKGKDESILAFSVKGTRAAGIEGLDSEIIDAIFSSHEAQDNSGGDILDSFLTFGENVSIQAGMVVNLLLAFDFSKLKNKALSKLLPNPKAFELASATLFMQTAETTHSVTTINESEESTEDIVIRPGIYAFAGIGDIQDIIQGLFEYVMNFVASIITLIDPDFNLEDLTNDIIHNNSDAQEDDSFGFGVSITDTSFGVILNIPVAFLDSGSFKAECKFDYDGTELDCSTEYKLGLAMFWKIIWEDIEGSTLYEIYETFYDGGQLIADGGKLIAAGFGDAVDGVKDIFSKDNMDASAEFILDLGEDIKDFGEDIVGWAKDVLGGELKDGMQCGFSTCKRCKNPKTYWYKKAFTACGSEPKWDDGKICALGTSCNACKNKATWWGKKFFTACGSQPTCLGKNKKCGSVTTGKCSKCCSGEKKCNSKGKKCRCK